MPRMHVLAKRLDLRGLSLLPMKGWAEVWFNLASAAMALEPNGDSTAFRTAYAPRLAQCIVECKCDGWRVMPSRSDKVRIDGPDSDSALRAAELCAALNRVYAQVTP